MVKACMHPISLLFVGVLNCAFLTGPPNMFELNSYPYKYTFGLVLISPYLGVHAGANICFVHLVLYYSILSHP